MVPYKELQQNIKAKKGKWYEAGEVGGGKLLKTVYTISGNLNILQCNGNQ